MKKLTRTISGVTPVAVMSRPAPCPGRCIYCPDFENTPRSYTPHSPAVIRAAASGYDAVAQTATRLRILADMGHPTDKIELIIMGGTFLSTPLDYQDSFIKGCFDALNNTKSETLEEAQHCNETAFHRAVGLCIETRPDVCDVGEIARMIGWGVTRVELGVQTLDEEVFRIVNRGHSTVDVVKATARLRQAGLKVHYHWMPGLPGSKPENDLALTRELFENPDFRPDGLKIYPTMVVENTELQRWHAEGRYEPYPDEVMTGLIAEMKKLVPPYVRISRVLRDIPAEYITGGLKNSMRDTVQQRLEEQGTSCRCIRCRELGHRQRLVVKAGLPSLRRLDYEASGGQEVFLSFEDDSDTLYGLLRLRVQQGAPAMLAGGDGVFPLIRELHVYGPELSLGKRDTASAQHRGYGRELVREAEKIARDEFGASSLAVLSGVGARRYYHDLGYILDSSYMVKRFNPY
ncbi:elongator complex protein 3 [Dehalogenimonas alkenigignens]|uniref:Elongator complex protein 3 n=1 Tax=Dehalogenimonas alkenigignens TaxID=1217799 RepID=A0A0W0GJ58_9CHLR|nr:tRNA uridine(34) 5-carboxymethylaminomethyl modification radical SAM/GNAT enzyme Elp3 [Dehalogenimonas alkenigignens]KTB48577.1 radical SAM enzyme/protein acetyltransferase, ELP3 family [Dehalogenimonas alkenigignens]PVV84982.1 tRNA uridine(34) 5-carboxymethylaminomethyl modification radical SAM/GNAT enzyme Elp3 [Dehalogenimonas alkenigignens]